MDEYQDIKLISPLKNISFLEYPFGNVFQNFGENPQLYYRFGLVGHNGVDLVTFEGDEIRAVCDGTILKVDYGETTFGWGVWQLSSPYLCADGITRCFMMVYFHAGKILVQNGQKVKAGDALCLEGNTGFVVSGSTPYWGNAPAGKGTHLHFGIYPLIQGTDKGNAYWINGQGYIKEFPNNGYNGATDPLRFYLETEAQTVIDKAKLVIANVLAYLKGRTK